MWYIHVLKCARPGLVAARCFKDANERLLRHILGAIPIIDEPSNEIDEWLLMPAYEKRKRAFIPFCSVAFH